MMHDVWNEKLHREMEASVSRVSPVWLNARRKQVSILQVARTNASERRLAAAHADESIYLHPATRRIIWWAPRGNLDELR